MTKFERLPSADRRSSMKTGRRAGDRPPSNPLCEQTHEEVVRLRAVVESLGPVIRTLADAVQALTASRHKPE